MRKIEASQLKATIEDVEYTWVGGFGCVLESYEKNVKQNDVRIIGGIIFYAWSVDSAGWWGTRRISWTPQQEVTNEFLQDLRKAIFT